MNRRKQRRRVRRKARRRQNEMFNAPFELTAAASYDITYHPLVRRYKSPYQGLTWPEFAAKFRAAPLVDPEDWYR